MSEDRFYTRELIGSVIGTGYGHGGGTPKLSVYIMDRLYNCRVVETFERRPTFSLGNRTRIRRLAEQRCAQLNEWWRLELQRG